MAKKTNPRRIPRTQADVEKAESEGHVHGAEFMLYVVLFLLEDRIGLSHEKVKELGDAVGDYCVQLKKSEIKIRDVRLALKEEYGLTVRI